MKKYILMSKFDGKIKLMTADTDQLDKEQFIVVVSDGVKYDCLEYLFSILNTNRTMMTLLKKLYVFTVQEFTIEYKD